MTSSPDPYGRASGAVRLVILSLLLHLSGALPLGGQSGAASGGSRIAEHRDLVYAEVDGSELRLDLFVPAGGDGAPLVVWVHGGAWRSGSKADVPGFFAEGGYAAASLDFRQSTDAPFPAAVHDIKAAIRYLRAVAPRYGFSADRIAISGSSSGAHLAALVGVSNGHAELEGTVGAYLDGSSSVQAIVSYFGASNLTTILAQSTPFGLSVRVPALELFLGGQPEEVPDVALLASPVAHVDPTDPALLLFHGDQDPQMPINQSHELEGAYERLGLDVTFHVLHGATHGSTPFFSPEQNARVLAFLSRTIGPPPGAR